MIFLGTIIDRFFTFYITEICIFTIKIFWHSGHCACQAVQGASCSVGGQRFKSHARKKIKSFNFQHLICKSLSRQRSWENIGTTQAQAHTRGWNQHFTSHTTVISLKSNWTAHIGQKERRSRNILFCSSPVSALTS